MSVQLVIKSAAQSVDDYTLSCEMTWTIAQVKEQLSNEYPTKPKKEHQRLIYGGRLLPDHLSLKSVLNHTQDIHTMHLVCPTPVTPKPVELNEKKVKPSSPVYTASPPPSSSGVYPQMNPQTIAPGLNSGLPGSSWNANTIPDPTQQYMVMQQMYMQMMSQYFAQLNGSIPYGPLIANTPPVQPPPVTSRPNVQQNNRPRQGEEEERDYIDYLYVFSRIAVLAALLLYYSSPMRVIGVLVMMLFVLLLAQILQKQRREEMQRQSERQQNAAEEQSSADNQASENEQDPETSTGSDSVSSGPQNANQPATSVPYTIFTLITAFFSSLIPSDPLPVNVN